MDNHVSASAIEELASDKIQRDSEGRSSKTHDDATSLRGEWEPIQLTKVLQQCSQPSFDKVSGDISEAKKDISMFTEGLDKRVAILEKCFTVIWKYLNMTEKVEAMNGAPRRDTCGPLPSPVAPSEGT